MTQSQEAYKKAKEEGTVKENKFIKFKGKGERIVKFINDERFNGTNYRTHQPEEKMRYTFEENGETKLYEPAIYKFTKTKDSTGEEITEKDFSNFIKQMNDYDYGDTLKMVSTPIPGTPREYIKIDKMNLGADEEAKMDDDDIPIMEEGEGTGGETKVVKKVNLAEGGEMNAGDIEY